MKKRTLVTAFAAAGLTFLMMLPIAQATVTNVDHAAIKPGYPTSWAEWTSADVNERTCLAGECFGWNPENARPGNHPDRPDGVIYIFPDAASANSWWDGVTGTAPDEIPDDAVAYIHWELDNGSGEFPGIMAISDDYDFSSNNCIMASGSTIPGEITKTCSNDQGTSKRFKLVVIKPGVPVDLHFNTEAKDLVFADVPDDGTGLASDDGSMTNTDMFRAYRHLIKWGNGSGTDTANGSDSAARISGFNVIVGDESGNPIAGLTFETSTTLDGYLLAKKDNVPKDFWNANEFATFSPSMYSLVGDNRAEFGGFWDKNPAGIYPGIPSGTSHVGSNTTTGNYEDVKGNVDGTSGLPTYAGDFFGELMYYGIISAGDTGQLPVGIYQDDDGDPATEGGLYAWWDGSDFRWGIDGKVTDGQEGTDADAWAIVSDEDLAIIAYNELDENATPPFGGPKYEIGHADDLGGLNMDVYVKLDAAYTPGKPFTIRLETTAASEGSTDGDWVTTPAPTLEELRAVLPDPDSDDTGDTSTGGGSGGGGGGCVAGDGTAWNITIPATLVALLGYGLFRRRRQQ